MEKWFKQNKNFSYYPILNFQRAEYIKVDITKSMRKDTKPICSTMSRTWDIELEKLMEGMIKTKSSIIQNENNNYYLIDDLLASQSVEILFAWVIFLILRSALYTNMDVQNGFIDFMIHLI